MSSTLQYLGLPVDYRPSPVTEPVDFLKKHLRELPPHLLPQFSLITTPKQRTVIPTIRNRRLKYANLNPQHFDLNTLGDQWHALREGGLAGSGRYAGEEEKEWVRTSFLHGSTTHVGKLGSLLAEEEEARTLETIRSLRRRHAVDRQLTPEEESESEDDGGEEDTEGNHSFPEGETAEVENETVWRVLKERFIYGMLDGIDYDVADWDDSLDTDHDREEEERWILDSSTESA